MKKFLILILLLAIIVVSGMGKKEEFSFSDYFDYGELTVYRQSDGENEILPNITTYINNQKILGESIYFENVEVGKIIQDLSAKLLFSEELIDENLTILYCYSPNIPKTAIVKGQEINLQIATGENYTVVGWPMILGGF